MAVYTPIANTISLNSTARPFADIPNAIKLHNIAPLYAAIQLVLDEVERELNPEITRKAKVKA